MLYQVVSNVAEKLDLFVDDDMTVADVRTLVAAMILSDGGEGKTVRLTFQGHHLENDDETWSDILRAYPIQPNAPRKLFVHVSSAVESGAPSLEALRAALPSSSRRNSDESAARAQAKMMEPLIDNLVHNPQLIEMMIASQPQLQRMARNNPEMWSMLRNPDTMKSIMMSQLDPDQMRQMSRTMELQLAQVSAVPGGEQMLERYMAGCQRDLEAGDAVAAERNVAEAAEPPPPDPTKKANNEALPNPWQRAAPANANMMANQTSVSPMASLFPWMMMPQQQQQQQQQRQQQQQQQNSGVADAVRWAEQIAMLRDMGFSDEALCIEALRAANGDVDVAVNFIVQRLHLE